MQPSFHLAILRFGKAIQKCKPTQVAMAAHLVCQFSYVPGSSFTKISLSSILGSS